MDPSGRLANVLRSGREHLFGPSDSWFVTNVFRALLWREPDEAGRRWYVDGLRSGRMSRFKVLRDVGQSTEAAKHMMFGPGFRQYVHEFTINGCNVPADVPPVLFLHPMKCGGTALAQGLSKLCDPWPRILDLWIDQLVCYPRPMLAQARLVTGHLPFAAAEVLPSNLVTVTVVREPVSRTLSHFAHLRTHGGEPSLTLESFVHDRRLAWEDYQARMLAVDVPAGAAWRGDWPASLQALVDSPLPLGEDELRKRAFERLDAISIVGVQDDLHAVVRAVAAAWGKPSPPPLERENTSLAPVRRADVAPELLAEIEAGTRIDAELYERAKERAASISPPA